MVFRAVRRLEERGLVRVEKREDRNPIERIAPKRDQFKR
jgi:uncharacterized membrane protein